jgi:hypothetical protein
MENSINSENEKLNWVAPQIITVNPEQTEAGTYPMSVGEGVHDSVSKHYTGS